MHKAIHNKDGSLKHSNECKMAFGKKDPNCPRCVELIGGAQVRSGWQKSYYEKKAHEAHINTLIGNHVCSERCGVVCTANQW